VCIASESVFSTENDFFAKKAARTKKNIFFHQNFVLIRTIMGKQICHKKSNQKSKFEKSIKTYL
jgi:hypothetical protein